MHLGGWQCSWLAGPAATTQDADPFELSVSCFGVVS